jgi:hypothetical protein
MERDVIQNPRMWPVETIECIKDFLSSTGIPVQRNSYAKDDVHFLLEKRHASYSISYADPEWFKDCGVCSSSIRMKGTYAQHYKLMESLLTNMEIMMPGIVANDGAWFYSFQIENKRAVFIVYSHGHIFWMVYRYSDTTASVIMYRRSIDEDSAFLSDYGKLIAGGGSNEALVFIEPGKEYTWDEIFPAMVQISQYTTNASICAECNRFIM